MAKLQSELGRLIQEQHSDSNDEASQLLGNTGTTDLLPNSHERPPRRIFDITKMLDTSGMTPIHYAASQNIIEAIEMLCLHVLRFGDGNRYQRSSENDRFKRAYLKDWVNSPTRCDDHFTPMHYAAFFGNLQMIELLMRHGGDPHVQNEMKINMLHVAAQGDKPQAIAFFLREGLNINARDRKESTPLHWAAFAGADLALTYILSWGGDVNAQDSRGVTPLHLAVKTAEDIQSTRSVRALILRSADTRMLDNERKLPIDYAEDVQDLTRPQIEFKRELQQLVEAESDDFW